MGFLALAALLGRAWRWGPIGPVVAPLFVTLATSETRRRRRVAMALSYFLAGSSGLPAGAATFFGPGSELRGFLLWIASAALLALPWAWAGGGKGILTALLLDAVPPLGCFGWLSPLAAAGVCYPHTGLLGLGLLLALFTAMATRNRTMTVGLLAVAVGVNGFVLFMGTPPPPPPRWIGVDTHVGPLSGDPLKTVRQRAVWIVQVRRHTRTARVVVLPETIAGPWWPGTAAQIRAAVRPGQTWLVGATAWVHEQRADAVMEVSTGRRGKTPLFISPFPVPVSMWHPWRPNGYLAAWWEPVRTVHGRRVWTALCYDQLLPWVWVEGLLQSPQVVLAVSNDWWAQGTGVSGIQRATTWAWARLMGAVVVRAENRSGHRPRHDALVHRPHKSETKWSRVALTHRPQNACLQRSINSCGAQVASHRQCCFSCFSTSP